MDGIEVIRGKVAALPNGPGVYRMLNEKDDVLYVGKAKNLKARVVQYTQVERMGGRIRKMVFETRDMVFVETRSEVEALLLEANLIKSLKPRYNIIFRDDASYVSVVITEEETPMIRSHRGARRQKGAYFGPYPSAGSVYATLDVMERAFRLRTCKDSVFKNRTRPCLKYDIKRCSGPCVGRISPEEYAANVLKAKRFLKGERAEVLAQLQADMTVKAEALDYEGAAAVRDSIRALSDVRSAATAMTHGFEEADVFALVREGGKVAVQAFYYRHGQHSGNHLFQISQAEEGDDAEVMAAFIGQHYANRAVPVRVVVNVAPYEVDMLAEALSISAGRKVVLDIPTRGDKRLVVEQAEHNARGALRRALAEADNWQAQMVEFQGILGLAEPIQRVECYDISNTQGKQPVASGVVAGPEGMVKREYKRYAVKTKDTPDDYAMLREVLGRRMKRAAEGWALPDAFLIDGGKGQLGVLVDVAQEMGVEGPALCSIAKGEERDKGLEVIWRWDGEGMVQLPVHYNTPLMFVLQRIRDEAHRFAITYHRAKRAKALVESALGDIPGIGPRKKKALLLHFGSVAAIKDATVEELVRVEGISHALAEVLQGWWKGQS